MEKKQYVVLTQLTFDSDSIVNTEIVDSMSLTEPDDCVSIKDLISRMAMGYAVEQRQSYYDMQFDEDSDDNSLAPDVGTDLADYGAMMLSPSPDSADDPVPDVVPSPDSADDPVPDVDSDPVN